MSTASPSTERGHWPSLDDDQATVHTLFVEPRCYVCGLDAGSVEHIIPAGIGGALRSRALLCKEHNNELGRELDAELGRQLLPLLNMLGVAPKKKTPDVPVEVPTREGEWLRSADGKLRPRVPTVTTTEHGDGTATLHVQVSSRKQARQVLQGYKRKHPKLDVEAAMANIAPTDEPYYGQVLFRLDGLGGDTLFRAVAKVILGFALHRGVPQDQVPELLSCVVGTTDTSIVSPCYQVELPPESPRFDAHALVIRSEGHRLVGYIEFLGVLRFMVLLSDTYNGPTVREGYGYRVVETSVFEPRFGPLPAFVPNSALPLKEVRAAGAAFLRYVGEKTKSQIIRDAIAEAMGRVGEPGDLLDVQDVLRETFKELEKTLLKRVTKHPPGFGSTPKPPASKHDPCSCGSGRTRRRCCFPP